MSQKPGAPEQQEEGGQPQRGTRETPAAKPGAKPGAQEPGTNAVEHEPDPKAQPIPDGTHKYVPRSPYTAGNS